MTNLYIRFPGANDPVERSLQEVGAMTRGVHERKTTSPFLSSPVILARPRTGDVSTYTQTLGIIRGTLHDDGGVLANSPYREELGLVGRKHL